MPTLDEARTNQGQSNASATRLPRGEDHGHDHDDHDHHAHDHHDHDHDHHDHDEHDHEHEGHDHNHEFGWLQGAQIAVALVCAALLWFGEYTFFSVGSIWSHIHNFADSIDSPGIRDLPLGDFLPSALRAALPVGLVNWIDAYLDIPFSAFGAFVLVFSGWPIFKEAFHNLLERRMTMELSMTIAIIAAAYSGYFFVVAWIIFFVLLAEVLEGLTVGRGRRAIRELLEFLPRNVTVRRSGQIVEVDTSDLSINETVLVAPGGSIPVDGSVEGGHSFVDESRITGESMPVEKLAEARVYAGSINQSGVLEVRTERIGADTSYGKIIQAVEQAERSRAPITRTADRLAGYIVLFAIGFAAWNQWMFPNVTQTISILIVAGACGVAAGTPLAILGAIGRSARLGAIVKGGVHMEMLSRVNTVVLDKTGTLTFGKPSVNSIVAAPGVGEGEVLAAAAAAELRSEHPLGKAIVERAKAAQVEIQEPSVFAYTPGKGIAATVDGRRLLVGSHSWLVENGVAVSDGDGDGSAAASKVFVSSDGRFLGVIAIADAVRPEARKAIDGMHRMGIRTILLTGDNARVAEAVARELGITEVAANMLPEAKIERVQKLVAEGKIVAMVGDGVNDAPALAAASVGVAMGSGTDVARESADVVLLGNDLARFVDALGVARWARVIIWQNFAGTIFVDIAGIAAAFMGFIGPAAAINIHTGSELLFILNSARLLPRLAAFTRDKYKSATVAPASRPAPGTAAA